MKIETNEATVTSNLPDVSRKEMGIDAAGMRHIMGLLTNLYNDRELAVIREYYTNGLDAHTAAGVTAPVRITLPTWDKPNYVVQDQGVGMSEDDIMNVYSQYGASTGRNSNNIVGGFGLGSKSAFTIAKQFTVVSVKDGKKTTALFSKTAVGVYDAAIVSRTDTTEGNGTIVRIPIDVALHVFNSKAENFFRFSTPGSVLVNGKEPLHVLDEAEPLVNPKRPDMKIHLKPKSNGNSYVIMGSVPYVLSVEEINLSLSRLGVRVSDNFVRMPKFFTVPIGSVELSPNREGLQMTDKTNKVIDDHLSFIFNDLKEIAVKEIDKSTDLEDFFQNYDRWNGIISVPREFKGEPVPIELKVSSVREIVKSTWSNASHTDTWYVRTKVSGPRIVVTGLAADDYKKVNNYLLPYMNAMEHDRMTFLVTDDPDLLDDKWIKFSKLFTFVASDDIIEIGREQRKKERKEAAALNGSAKRSKIKYPVLNIDEETVTWLDHDEIDENTPYINAHDFASNLSEFIGRIYKNNFQRDFGVSQKTCEYFSMVTDSNEVILLGKTRTVKALEQRVKKTTSLFDAIKAYAETADYKVTPELIRHQAVQSSSWDRFLRSTNIDKIIHKVKDPLIHDIITPNPQAMADFEEYEKVSGFVSFFWYIGAKSAPYIDTSKDNTITVLDKKYPLVGALNAWSLNREGIPHLVKYFNMVHEEQNV